MPTLEETKHFEEEVRRIARQLWPEARFEGASMVAGRERDGIFATEDVVNIVESTTSRKKGKAEDDIEKIVQLSKEIRSQHPDKVVKGWFVTQHDPEAEQRAVADKYKATIKIVVCSIDTFRQRLIDAPSYLQLREKYRFGSLLSSDNLSGASEKAA